MDDKIFHPFLEKMNIKTRTIVVRLWMPMKMCCSYRHADASISFVETMQQGVLLKAFLHHK